MATPDLSQGFDTAKSKINSYSSYIGISQAAKKLEKDAGNSESESTANLTSSLDKISTQQKRYLRNPPNSFDQLLDLIGLASGTGSGPSSLKYLRKTLLQTAVKIEPDIQKIISEEALKALGCSQEQTFNGYSVSNLEQLNGLQSLNGKDAIYVPIQSLDIGNILKLSPESEIGKIVYEKPAPSADSGVFRPYGGKDPFPMNKTLNLTLNNSSTYSQTYGKYYQGTSGQNLFDMQYSTTNGVGVTQDCYKVALIDKVNTLGTSTGGTSNKVGEFLKDYYSTIKLVDSVDITANLMNLISGAVSMNLKLGEDDIQKGTTFSLIVQRILGLCFDSRREIDVSGVSKVAELDGVDESFFELTEVDLRNIDLRITNIQNGVMEFEDCDNVKLPVDYETLANELIVFRDSLSAQTAESQVKSIEGIIDTLYQNPEWKAYLPTNFNAEIAVNKDILKQIPLAVASSVLSPKVLLPIFILLQVIEGNATNEYNNAITPANQVIQSGNTNIGQVNNIVNNQVDFLKVFKKFNIEIISRIGAIFIKTLFDILKKDIVNLLSIIISDIAVSEKLKKYRMILRLVQLALIISQLVDDYRKCKSLVKDILLLLNTINNGFLGGKGKVPVPLLILSDFLPGTSPERSTINTISYLQSVGIPTGALPDGSPNLMSLQIMMSHKGADQEQAENGKLDAIGLSPVVGPVQIYGKWV